MARSIAVELLPPVDREKKEREALFRGRAAIYPKGHRWLQRVAGRILRRRDGKAVIIRLDCRKEMHREVKRLISDHRMRLAAGEQLNVSLAYLNHGQDTAIVAANSHILDTARRRFEAQEFVSKSVKN